MSTINESDRVRLVTREATDEDIKSSMYFNHYGGLTGTVLKVYGPNEVAVEIEQDSLTREIRRRHDDVRDQMKTKWLDGLSEEGRNKLTEREKDFNLRYIVLVSSTDMEKIAPRPVAQSETPEAAQASIAPTEDPLDETPRRKTLADLEAAEEAEFARRSNM